MGVDGCRGGWLAATCDGGAHPVMWRLSASFRELYDDAADVIAVDIPIGLPASGARACDVEARSMLGRRGVSVFPAPPRPVLGCASYAEARGVLAGLGGASMSAQAFGIVRAVRDVDSCLTDGDDARVVEAHPEVAFCAMGGGAGLASKRSTAGAATRLRLLQSWRPDVLALLGDVPSGAPLDDALDALACLWVAQRWMRGEAMVLGDRTRDERDLPMRIVA